MFWARFVSDGSAPVQVHWPGLSDSEAIDAIDAAQWDRLAINNNNREEVAVYLRVSWALLRDHEVLGNAVYYTEDAARSLGQPGTVVRWQFEVDCEGPPGHAAIKGFTPARSCVRITPPPTPQQRAMRDKSLVFRIHDRMDLAALLRATLGDATGEVTLFASDEAGAHRIIEALRSPDRPTLATLLPARATFLDLGLGVDLGYNDYVLVASADPIEPRLSPILEAAERAIVEYESRISPFTSPADALSLMEALAVP